MKIHAVRIVKFDMGHRVMNHESKCATLHGHEYKAEIYAEADKLDSLGRVIDFSVIKEKVGGWIDAFLDHTTAVCKDDKEVVRGLLSMPRYKEPFICDFNPTAENLAEYLLKEVCPKVLADTNVVVTKIRLWETSNCYVEVTL